MPSKSTSCGNKGSNALEAPSFSRPAQVEPGIPTVKGIHSVVQGCRYTNPASEAPMFARPNQTSAQPQFHSQEKAHNFAPKGEQKSCLTSLSLDDSYQIASFGEIFIFCNLSPYYSIDFFAYSILRQAMSIYYFNLLSFMVHFLVFIISML